MRDGETKTTVLSINKELIKTKYTVDEDIIISGALLDGEVELEGISITLKIENEKGLVSVEQLETEEDGKFTHTFNLPEDSEVGTYTLTIKANDPVNQSLEEKLIIVEAK